MESRCLNETLLWRPNRLTTTTDIRAKSSTAQHQQLLSHTWPTCNSMDDRGQNQSHWRHIRSMDCGANMCQTRSETCSSRFWLLAGVFNWGHRQYFEYFKYQLDSTDRFWVVLDDWFAVAREKLLYPLKPTKTLPAPTCSINHPAVHRGQCLTSSLHLYHLLSVLSFTASWDQATNRLQAKLLFLKWFLYSRKHSTSTKCFTNIWTDVTDSLE